MRNDKDEGAPNSARSHHRWPGTLLAGLGLILASQVLLSIDLVLREAAPSPGCGTASDEERCSPRCRDRSGGTCSCLYQCRSSSLASSLCGPWFMLLLLSAPKIPGCVSEHGRSIPLADIRRISRFSRQRQESAPAVPPMDGPGPRVTSPNRVFRYHRGLLILSVKAESMMLKLMLILVSSLPLASTE